MSQVTQDIEAIRGYIQEYGPDLIYDMLNGLDFVRDLPEGIIRNLRTERNLPKMVVDDGVRPHNTEVEDAKGKRTWTARKLTPRYFMKIFKVVVQEVRQSFMSEMLAPNAKREPMAAWQWAREFEKVAEELNNHFYLAKYHDDPIDWDAGTVYNAGDLVYFDEGINRGSIVFECQATTVAGESPTSAAAKWADVDNKVLFDGPGTIIAAESGSGLTPFAGGSFNETDAYATIKAQWNDIPEADKNRGITAYMSVGAGEDLQENVNSLFGSGKGIGGVDVDIAAGQSFVLRNTAGRLRIKPCTWMGSSRRVIMTLPKNWKIGMDQFSDYNKVGKTVETLHGYKAIMSGMLTFNFSDLRVLWVNDQQ